MPTHVGGQQLGRPQFVGIAQILGLPAGQTDHPGPVRVGDHGGLAASRQISQRPQSPQFQGLVDAALDLGAVGGELLGDGRYALAGLVASSIRARSTRWANSVRERLMVDNWSLVCGVNVSLAFRL